MPARRASSSRCSRPTPTAGLDASDQGPGRRHRNASQAARQRGRWRRPDRQELRRQMRSPTFQPHCRSPATGCVANAQLAPMAVGHRVVHGGPRYDRPVLIDAEVLANLERLVSLAPLHQPNNLAPIRAILARNPELPQVACFDTAFHRSHDALADHYAIPEHFHDEGVRRYGFHGLSYEFIADRLQDGSARDRGWPGDRGASRQRRFDVRACGRPQRREHDGLHGARRAADGHAARPD